MTLAELEQVNLRAGVMARLERCVEPHRRCAACGCGITLCDALGHNIKREVMKL